MIQRRFRYGTFLAVLACILGAVPAKAALIITFVQNGSDVVASGAGSLDFTSLAFSNFDFSNPYVDASAGAVLLSPTPSVGTDVYLGNISGPTTFGGGGHSDATSGTGYVNNGSGAGVIGGGTPEILVPEGYNGEAFTVSATWANTTISGLGLTPGTYVWTWGTSTPDSLTVVIPGTATPEPSSLLLIFGGLSLIAARARKRSRG